MQNSQFRKRRFFRFRCRKTIIVSLKLTEFFGLSGHSPLFLFSIIYCRGKRQFIGIFYVSTSGHTACQTRNFDPWQP